VICFQCTASHPDSHADSVLHPGLKFEYFRKHGWEEEWVIVAEKLVRDEYVRTYEGVKEPVQDVATNESGRATVVRTVTCMCRNSH
jgi:hypothetical protein